MPYTKVVALQLENEICGSVAKEFVGPMVKLYYILRGQSKVVSQRCWSFRTVVAESSGVQTFRKVGA